MSRKIVVTAGASGIGREFVRAFSGLGDWVFVCDINAEALKALKAEIPGIVTHVCDISKRAEIERLAWSDRLQKSWHHQCSQRNRLHRSSRENRHRRASRN